MGNFGRTWPFWAKYSDWNVEAQGRDDGRRDPPIPAWEADEFPPFLGELVGAGEDDLQVLRRKWAREDGLLRPRYTAASQAAMQAEAESRRADDTVKRAEGAYEKAHDGQPAPTSDRRFALYGLGIAALALLEIPFNAIVFRPLGESEVYTLVFTLALALSVVGCAHWLGVALQKMHAASGRRLTTCAILVVLLSLVPLGVTGSVAWFRARYLSAPRPASTDVHVYAAGIAPSSPPRFDEAPALFAFFFFNLALFLVAFVYSYFAHDEPLKDVFRRRLKARRSRASLAAAERGLAYAKDAREKRHAEYCAQAGQIEKAVGRQVSTYRTHNLQSRPDRANYPGDHYPRCFAKWQGLAVPDELKTLSDDGPAPIRAASPPDAVEETERRTVEETGSQEMRHEAMRHEERTILHDTRDENLETDPHAAQPNTVRPDLSPEPVAAQTA